MNASSADLRGLAEEMDRLDRMESYTKELLANPGCIDLSPRVEWAWGGSCTGYKDFEAAARTALREGLLERMLFDLLGNQRAKVIELKAMLQRSIQK